MDPHPLSPGGPLAADLGIRVPIAQGPMTRVSDVAGFAAAVAADGGLPFIALALAEGERSTTMLRDAAMADHLTRRDVRVGVLMGTAYLFTREAVEHCAIKPLFQQLALSADGTALLETSPGHVIRALPTAYVDPGIDRPGRVLAHDPERQGRAQRGARREVGPGDLLPAGADRTTMSEWGGFIDAIAIDPIRKPVPGRDSRGKPLTNHARQENCFARNRPGY